MCACISLNFIDVSVVNYMILYTDLDNVYTSVIPGMGIADKNEKTETNNNSSKGNHRNRPYV